MFDQDHVFSGDPTIPGLLEAVRAVGIHTDNRDGTVYVSDPALASAIAASFDPLAYMIGAKRTEAGNQWWTHRNGGHVTASGIRLTTDDAALALINGAYSRAVSGSTEIFNFRDATGTWTQIDAAGMIALFNDISAWIQAVFNRWHDLETEIEGSITWQAAQAIDVTKNWPE